jgi:hypothetical protein
VITIKDLREELNQMSLDLSLTQKVYCSKEEVKKIKKMVRENISLPDDILMDDTGYFRYVDTDLTEEELNHLFLYRQLSYLYDIKNSMIFFVVLAIISLILAIIVVMK